MHLYDFLGYSAFPVRFDGIGRVDPVIQQILMNQAETSPKRYSQGRKVIMDIAVRAKLRDYSPSEKKVTGGFSKVSVTHRNGEISGFTQIGPNAVDAALPAVELSDRSAEFVYQSNPGTDQLGAGISIEIGGAMSESLGVIAIIGIKDADEVAVF